MRGARIVGTVCSLLLSGGIGLGVNPAATAVDPTPTPSPTATIKWPVPANSGYGRRIVYSQRKMHLWLINAYNVVVAHYPVTGRADHPPAGKYKVYSKSSYTISWDGRFYMKWMTRWYRGVNANVGFHSIPKTWSGVPIQTIADLGKPLGIGGCVRLAYTPAKRLYDWARLGTPVWVVR